MNLTESDLKTIDSMFWGGERESWVGGDDIHTWNKIRTELGEKRLVHDPALGIVECDHPHIGKPVQTCHRVYTSEELASMSFTMTTAAPPSYVVPVSADTLKIWRDLGV